MAADVEILEKIGAGGSANDKTAGTIRMKNADDALVDSNNPMVIPVAGSDFSFTKWLRLAIATGGNAPSDNISNIRAYFDGANGFGTGVSLWAKSEAAMSAPTEPATSSGYTDAFGFTSAAPMSLAGGPYSGSGTEMASHFVLLMEVSLTATVGALTAETLTFAYDEI